MFWSDYQLPYFVCEFGNIRVTTDLIFFSSSTQAHSGINPMVANERILRGSDGYIETNIGLERYKIKRKSIRRTNDVDEGE